MNTHVECVHGVLPPLPSRPWKRCRALCSVPCALCPVARRLYIGNMIDLTYTAFMVALSVAFNHQQTGLVPHGFLS